MTLGGEALYEYMYSRFTTESPYEYIGVVVWRSRRSFPTDQEIRDGIASSISRDAARGVRTVIL